MTAENSELHEMENQVTKGAKPAEPKQAAPNYVPDNAPIEDLGGPTPQNSKPTDGSNKLKTPSAAFAQAGDVQTKGSAGTVQQDGPLGAVGLKSSGYGRGANEEVEATDEVVSEAPAEESETVSEVQEIDIDLSDDVKALFEGEELSESFQEKAKTIFEATIKSKIAAVKESLEAQYQTQIDKDVAEWKSALQERVDDYLHYVAEEWITENALQVESGIRGELSESFMTGLKGLFEEHYVNIPEEKYDVLEAMVTKLDEMENKLNEQIDSNVALTKRLSVSVSDNILDEVSEGLALSQKEKLAELAKGVEFESEEQYRVQLNTLKESYFTKKPVAESQEVISEDAPVVEHSPAMEAYLQAVTKFQ
tara:strand:- start:164 stop:1258 length:1095 start_codon:yes stop_codon:yes gene_type:complete